jgi:hypothetical protein
MEMVLGRGLAFLALREKSSIVVEMYGHKFG